MKTDRPAAILRNTWMILALVIVLGLLLSINWYYFHRVRGSLDEEFNIRLQALAAFVSSLVEPSMLESGVPVDPAGEGIDSLLSLLERTRADFDLSDILLLREDGIVLLAPASSLFEPGDFYPVYNMDHAAIIEALEGRPSSSALARAQGGSSFKAGYAPFPPGSRNARVVAAVEADAEFLGGVSDLRNMLSAATAVSIAGLIVFIWFVVKATSSLLSTRESLLRSETLATMGRMAAGIAHEVRNPLFIIRSSAERLCGSHPESAGEIEEFIIEEADRLDSILSTYLEFASGEKSIPRMADLSVILSRSARLIGESRGPDDPPVEVQIDPGDYTLVCEEKRLQQVFMNIIINSVRSTGPDGSVKVSLRQSGGRFTASIEDTGTGIAPGDMERIFEPFFTTRSDGSGLGLAVARRITVEHGGAIEVESTEGEGTKVTVTLPAGGITEKERDEQDPDSR